MATKSLTTTDCQPSLTARRITILTSLRLGVKCFAKVVRGHWAIENTLRWCLKVTFREVECRLRDRIAGDNAAWLKRFALGILKQVNNKESTMRQRMTGWNNDFLTQLLAISTTLVCICTASQPTPPVDACL